MEGAGLDQITVESSIGRTPALLYTEGLFVEETGGCERSRYPLKLSLSVGHPFSGLRLARRSPGKGETPGEPSTFEIISLRCRL